MTFKEKLLALLNILTLGKYRTNLTFRKHQDHSTILGTIVTFILFSIVLAISIVILRGIFE